MSTKTKTLIDENVKPSTTILLLAWPVFVEQVLSTLVHSVDTAMVGSLGAIATASVSISGTPMMLINGIVMSFGMGFTALIARMVGAQNYERANSLIRQALTTVLMMGIPMSLLCYFLSDDIPLWMGAEADVALIATGYNKIMAYGMIFRTLTMVLSAIYRGYGDTKTPMIINTCVNLANVVGNYLLIYDSHDVTLFGKTFHVWGAGWGVNGAAASTSGTIAIGAIILLTMTFVRPTKLRISLKDSFKLNKTDMRAVTKISVPLMLERFVMGAASVVIATTVASLGTIAVASNSLASTIESFCFMPGFAFGSAATTLTGQSLGAERPDLGERYVATCVKMSVVVMGVGSVLMFIFAPQLMTLFTPDAQVVKTGSELVRLLAVIQIPYIISQIHSGALRGAGDTKVPLYLTLISMWGVRVLGATIFIRVMGLSIHWVIVAMNTDNVVRMILFWLRYKRGAWKTLRF
ncbi:MAG: MATE family efflux transporter [Oscillospiraceae bacterium]|nr:MATE family efflux transporter [Oscillospiraceae bacterium]